MSFPTFSSIHEFRAAYSALLAQLRDKGNVAEFLPEIEDFIEKGRGTGLILDSEQERWDSQRMLDYWATIMYRATYRAGLEPVDATLASFDQRHAKKLDDSLCPYLGLEAFQEENAGVFFGRTKLISQMIAKLSEQRFLAVVGPSGSGKSSLVRAGVVPELKNGKLPDSQKWHYFPKPMVPGSEPLANLARLMQPTGEPSPELIKSHSEAFLKEPGHLLKLLDAFAQKPSVLVIDQFEEVFTLCEDVQARKAFTDNLLEVIRAPESRHFIILTMRIDYEPFVTRLEQFYPYFHQAEERVPPLEASELREAIEAPAKAVELEFEEGVVENLLQDILGEPAALPLLQFTLRELWSRRRFNRVTMEAYEALGGGRLALARTADEIFNALQPEDQSVMKAVLLRMVRPGVGLEVTSSRVRRETLFQDYPRERVERVLNRLTSARLIRLTPGDAPADDQVEVAHEALVRNWPTLVEWLDSDRPAIIRRRQLEAKGLEWVRLGRGQSGLLDAVQLAEAKQWLTSPDASRLGYDKALTDLVAVSEKALDKEKRRLRAFISALIVLLLLTVAAAVTAAYKWQQADRALNEYFRVEKEAIAEKRRLELEKVEAVETGEKRLAKYQESKIQPAEPDETYKSDPSTSVPTWENGSTIRIFFMDGDPVVQNKVREFANKWTEYANLKFDFVSTHDADIRISFKQAGSWSMLGINARSVSKNQPTMNFGWLTPGTPDQEYSRTVLHEFGHALGLINENQNPNAELPWDKEKVYNYFQGPPNNWSKEQVDLQLFQKSNYKDYRPFDGNSIMTHAVPKELFIGDFQIRTNTVLSESDKSFIAKLYPK